MNFGGAIFLLSSLLSYDRRNIRRFISSKAKLIVNYFCGTPLRIDRRTQAQNN